MTVSEESQAPPGFPQNRVARMVAREGASWGIQAEVMVEGAFIQLSAEGVPERQVYLGITPAEFVMVKQDTQRTSLPTSVTCDPELYDLVMDTVLPLPVLKFYILDDRARRFSVCTCKSNTLHFEMCQLDGNVENAWSSWRKVLVKISGELGKCGYKTWKSKYQTDINKYKTDFEKRVQQFGGASHVSLSYVHQPFCFRQISSIGIQADQPEAVNLNGNFEAGNDVSDNETSSSDVNISLGEPPSRRLDQFSCEEGLMALLRTTVGKATVMPRKSSSWTGIMSYETNRSENTKAVLRLLKKQCQERMLNDSDSESDEDLDSYIQEVEARKAQGLSALQLWKKAKGLVIPRAKDALTDVFRQIVFKTIAKRKSGMARTFGGLDPVEAAQALTTISRRLLMSLRPSDIQLYRISKGKKLSRELAAVLDYGINISKMVASEIVKQQTVLGRTRVILRFTQICAYLLFHQHDFQSLAAILTGLTSLPVYRLDNTWVTLFMDKPVAFRQFLAIVRIISPKYDFLAYSRRIRMLQIKRIPYIPWLNHFLQHCTSNTNRRQSSLHQASITGETDTNLSVITNLSCPLVHEKSNRNANQKCKCRKKDKVKKQSSSPKPKVQTQGNEFEFLSGKTKIGSFIIDKETGEVRKEDIRPPFKPKSILSLNKEHKLSKLTSLFKSKRKMEHVHFNLEDDNKHNAVQTSCNPPRKLRAPEVTRETMEPWMDAPLVVNRARVPQPGNRAMSGVDLHSDATEFEHVPFVSGGNTSYGYDHACSPNRKPIGLDEWFGTSALSLSAKAEREVMKYRDLNEIAGKSTEVYNAEDARGVIKQREFDTVACKSTMGNSAKAEMEIIKPRNFNEVTCEPTKGYNAKATRKVIKPKVLDDIITNDQHVIADDFGQDDVTDTSSGTSVEIGGMECWTSSDSAFSEEELDDSHRPGPSTESNARKLNKPRLAKILIRKDSALTVPPHPATCDSTVTFASANTATSKRSLTATSAGTIQRRESYVPSVIQLSRTRSMLEQAAKDREEQQNDDDAFNDLKNKTLNRLKRKGSLALALLADEGVDEKGNGEVAGESLIHLTAPSADSDQHSMPCVQNVKHNSRKQMFNEAATDREENRNDDDVSAELDSKQRSTIKERNSLAPALLENNERYEGNGEGNEESLIHLTAPSADRNQRRQPYVPNLIQNNRRKSMLEAADKGRQEKGKDDHISVDMKSKLLNRMKKRGSLSTVALLKNDEENSEVEDEGDGESLIQKHFSAFLIKTIREQNETNNSYSFLMKTLSERNISNNSNKQRYNPKTNTMERYNIPMSGYRLTPFTRTDHRFEDRAYNKCLSRSKSLSLENKFSSFEDRCFLCAKQKCIYMFDRGQQLLQFQINAMRLRPRSKTRVENFIQNDITINRLLSEYDILQVSLPLE